MPDGALTLDGLRALNALLDNLSDVLQREHDQITARADAATIDATAQEKLRLFEAIGNCQAPQPPPQTAPAALHREWRTLEDSLTLVYRRNERNGLAIARILHTMGEELALLTGRERGGETYDPRGYVATLRGRMHTSA